MDRSAKVVVLGCGDPDCGDDAAGVLVACELLRSGPHAFEVCNIGSDPLRLLDFLRDFDEVIVVDATRSGAAPGTVRHFSAAELPRRDGGLVTQIHGIRLNNVVWAAGRLGTLPRHFTIIGIEGANFARGSPVTPSVAGAVHEVVDEIVNELEGGGQASRSAGA
jgi:hydrogenase maturation protease